MVKSSKQDKYKELRQKALKVLKDRSIDLSKFDEDKILEMLHDLQVHEVELELQNEELRKTQQELEVSRNKYSDLYDFAPVGYLMLDKEGRINESNLTSVTLLGVERKLLLNQMFSSYVAPESIEDFLHFKKQLFKSGETEACELKMRCRNKELLYARLEGIATADYTGKLSDCRITFSDITRRKSIEIAFRGSEQRYALAVSVGKIGLWEYDIISAKTSYDQSMKRLLGMSADDTLTEEIFLKDIIHPDDRQQLITAMNDYLERKTNVFSLEFQVKHTSGEYIWLLCRGKIIYKNKTPMQFMAANIDITEEKHAAHQLEHYSRELQKSNASKEKFFSIIAHDLKTPFTGFLGLSEHMEESADEMDTDEVRELAGRMHQSARRVFALLDNLLEWSRLQTGSLLVKKEHFHLVELVLDTFAQFQVLSENKHLNVTCDVDPELSVHADYKMTATILRNLVSNAIKFTPENGTVTVAAEAGSRAVKVSVLDTGEGLDEEEFEELIQIEKVGERRRKHDQQGSGLGLLLCKEFTEAQGGVFRARKRENQGSELWFTLPL